MRLAGAAQPLRAIDTLRGRVLAQTADVHVDVPAERVGNPTVDWGIGVLPKRASRPHLTNRHELQNKKAVSEAEGRTRPGTTGMSCGNTALDR